MAINPDLQNKRKEARLKAMNPSVSYSGFDLMKDISTIAEDSIRKSYHVLEKNIFGEEVAPTAVFLYGSGGRNEMTNYSDIDIHFVSSNEDSRTSEFRTKLHEELASYQFGKIDDPNWKNMGSIENYASRSITEANQIFDAKLVAGDGGLSEKMMEIIRKYDTPERKVRNMLFQKFYLEHYYNARSNAEVPNVKYCSGGYRDLLTFDWVSNWVSSTQGLPLEAIKDMPQVQHSILDMCEREIITPKQKYRVLESSEFMVLLRNEILHANLGTDDECITHLDNPTMERTWYSSPDYFKSLGLSHSNQLLPLFNKHAGVIKEIKDVALDYVISSEVKNRGNGWMQDYNASLSKNTSKKERERIAKSGDVITELSSIWGMNYHADASTFNKICEQMVNTTQWEALASMACSPKSSPELLNNIAKISMRNEGLGYILRIIGRSPSVSRNTLEEIAGNTSLDKRYRVVAKLHLEKGLYTATTRAS